jgi:hypothetical protein
MLFSSMMALQFLISAIRVATFALAARWGIRQLGVPSDAESRYAWEKHMMKEGNLSPLVAVPDFAAADVRVRNGPPSAWGKWNLSDLWLDRSAALSNYHPGASKMHAGTRP